MNLFVVFLIAAVLIILIITGLRELYKPPIFVNAEEIPHWQKITTGQHESLRQVSPEPNLYEFTDSKGTRHRTLVDEAYGWRLPHSPSSPPHA